MGKTVFLDRDGVINACAKAHDYIKTWNEFRFLDGAAEGIRALNQAGYQIVVVTNQRGVARGLMSRDTLDNIHVRMCSALGERGVYINAVFVCPHNEGECSCRKPKTGLFLQAEQMLSIDKETSWMIGDSDSDMVAGARYGVRTILIGSGNTGEYRGKSLQEAAKIIIERELKM